jgi:hypothetical protein
MDAILALVGAVYCRLDVRLPGRIEAVTTPPRIAVPTCLEHATRFSWIPIHGPCVSSTLRFALPVSTEQE